MKKILLSAAVMAATIAPTHALERLHYHVKFGFLKAGEAEITFEQPTPNTYNLTALAWTTTSIFNLQERIKVAGGKNFTPETFTMQQIEGDYQANKSLKLGATEAIYTKEGDAPHTFNPHGAKRDYLSALFRLRVNPEGTAINVGDTITENIVGLNGAYRMELKVREKTKIFTPGLKWQEVFVLQPVMVSLPPKSGISDDWRLYITADARRIPVRIDAKLKFGSFKAILNHVGDEKSPIKAPKGLQTGSIFPKS